MGISAARLPRPRAIAAARIQVRAGTVLAVLIGASTVVRSVIALGHTTARYLPDEYIYSALGRSIAHGHLEIRGHAAHFPGLLEPILAAPLWGLLPLETAYRAVQVENALFASLAAIPVYLLARRLGLRPLYGYACAAYALVVPMLVMIPFTVSDFVAYPLVLGAVTAGVDAIDRPSWRREVAFLALASLATLARVEYCVVVAAYIVAAVLVERRGFVKRHRIASLALVPAAIVLGIAATGYFSERVHNLPLGMNVLHQLGLQMFLLTLVAGVAMVPGAVAGLLRTKDRVTTSFALFAGALAVLLLLETSVFSADTVRFKERYVFMLLPLIAVAFGVYLRRGRPHRWVVFGLAAVVAVLAARLPLSAYATGAANFDSQSLDAAEWLQEHWSVGSASLAIALGATAAALVALLTAFRGTGRPALGVAFALALALTAGAVAMDRRTTSAVRRSLPADLQWIDHSAHGNVTAIATPLSSHSELLLQLYWNPSVTRELRLTNAIGTDIWATDHLGIGKDGTLEGVSGDFLFDSGGSLATFSNATLVKRVPRFQLWRSHGSPRFRLLIEGYVPGDWLTPNGRIRVWPRPGAAVGTRSRVSFVLSLPASRTKKIRLQLGARWFDVAPGARVPVTCTGGKAPLEISYRASNVVFDPLLRPLSVQLTHLRVSDLPPSPAGSAAAATTCTPAG